MRDDTAPNIVWKRCRQLEVKISLYYRPQLCTGNKVFLCIQETEVHPIASFMFFMKYSLMIELKSFKNLGQEQSLYQRGFFNCHIIFSKSIRWCCMTWCTLLKPIINKNSVRASMLSHGMCSMFLMHVNLWPCALGGWGGGDDTPLGGTVPLSVWSQGVFALTRLPVWERKDPGSLKRNRGSSESRSREKEKHSRKQEVTIREVCPLPRFSLVQFASV